MNTLRKLKSPRTNEGDANAPVNLPEQGDGQLVSPKPKFVKPKLTPHGDLVDVTGPFGGTLTP